MAPGEEREAGNACCLGVTKSFYENPDGCFVRCRIIDWLRISPYWLRESKRLLPVNDDRLCEQSIMVLAIR